ncbi:hypothetical protein ACTFIY_007661 [Dictyostelium cf. discoideum]
MSTKECYFCDQIVELFEFHRHKQKEEIIKELGIVYRLARGHWFDVDEFQISNRLTLFLDGNLTPTSSAPSKELRKKMHSGKDKVECISIIGIVDGFGKFQYFSHSFAGSIPDQVSLNFLSLSNTEVKKFGTSSDPSLHSSSNSVPDEIFKSLILVFKSGFSVSQMIHY